MVKTREPKSQSTPDPAALERFAAGAESDDRPMLDPNAPRNHKALSMHFNRYEWSRLESACQKNGTFKTQFLTTRHACARRRSRGKSALVAI